VFNSERGRSFYHLLFLGAALFVMSVTKMAYGQPRMFWTVEKLIPDECTTEYGNPSGHTELAIGYPMLLYLDLFENSERQRITEQKMSWGQIISLITVFLYSFLIGYARLYVRVHSWNQIILGWQLGIWLAFYFHFCLRESVLNHVNRIMSAKKMFTKDRRRQIVIASGMFILEVIALIGTYLASKYLNEPDPAWTTQIESKCPSK
jgi:hypothetical protein